MDQDQKQHRCKFCLKAFACGRSLGGHMRSHASGAPSPSAADEIDEKLQSIQASRGSYGLRENPKKTWRLSAASSDAAGDFGNKQCRECGREFQSWKALFGHMRCHSGRKKDQELVDIDDAGGEEEEAEVSWSAGSHLEAPPPAARKRRSRRAPSSTYVSDEDVAICLMMLSRDSSWLGFSTFAAESSDKNSAAKKSFDLGDAPSFFSAESSDKNSSVKKSLDLYSPSDSDHFDFEQNHATDSPKNCSKEKRSKYECSTCNKSFHSYQALGGHRASHKRMKGCSASNESTVETNEEEEAGRDNHQCLKCGKFFASGQALGGHQRSHLAAAASPEPELIDLNLLAPIDEDSSNGSSWWSVQELEHDALMMMISN